MKGGCHHGDSLLFWHIAIDIVVFNNFYPNNNSSFIPCLHLTISIRKQPSQSIFQYITVQGLQRLANGKICFTAETFCRIKNCHYICHVKTTPIFLTEIDRKCHSPSTEVAMTRTLWISRLCVNAHIGNASNIWPSESRPKREIDLQQPDNETLFHTKY